MKTKLVTIILALLILGTILSSCALKSTVTGVVTDKVQTASHVMLLPSVTCTGKTCTTILLPVFVPANYDLFVKTDSGVFYDCSVDEGFFVQHEVGSTVECNGSTVRGQ